MKFAPTQTERTMFLWLALAFMAMLVPQCWWTIRWDVNATVCSMWMLTFASLLITTSLITGTKRQVVGWLVSMASLLVACWFSPAPKLHESVKYWHHLGSDVTGLVNSTEATIRLAAVCMAVYVVSYVFSFVLDRFVGPVNGETKERPGTDEESGIKEEKGNLSGRIRLLVVAAGILFVVQAANNLIGFNSKTTGMGQSFLTPIVASLIPVLCCGVICRLRGWPAFGVGIVAAITMAGVAVTLAVQGGSEINREMLVYSFGFCSIVLAAVFVFLGNSRQPIQFAKSGWLFVVTAALALALPVMNSKYDLYSLLLTSPQFDFEEAAFRRELKSIPGVDVTLERRYGRNLGRLSFDFTPAAADSFFNDFEISRLPKSLRLEISGMGNTVDLSNLKNHNVSQLYFSKCEFTSKQLADVARLEIPIWFNFCNFTKSELGEPAPAFRESIALRTKELIPQRQVKPSSLIQFIDATQDFRFESALNFRNVLSGDGLEAALDLLEKTGDEVEVSILSIGDEVDIDALKRRKNLERLTIKDGDFAYYPNRSPAQRACFALLLETKAKAPPWRGHPDIHFWKLAVGAKTEFWSNVIREFGNSTSTLLGSVDGEDSPFVYQAADTGAVEKLWLPQCSDDVLKKVSSLKALKAVSFDIGWLGNQELTGIAASGVPVKLQTASLLNQLTNLEELYFSGMEIVDLSLLTELGNLKTIQFSSSTAGFSQKLFPNLEEVQIILDQPIKNGLMQELDGFESLKRLVVIDIHVSTFQEDKFLEQARALLGDQVETLVVDGDDGKQLAPAEFNVHRERVRQRCIEEYVE